MQLHPSFPQPEDNDTKVWRYLSLSKFIDFILTNSLYLSRLDLLDDKHEGTFTKSNASLLKRSLHNPNDKDYGKSSDQKWFVRETTFVNCWRLDNMESAAMWKIYCPNNDGVAIQTTYKNLALSLPESLDLGIGCIKYLDYENDTFDVANIFNSLMHKRLAFEYEKEVRIILKIWPNVTNEYLKETKGMPLKINLIQTNPIIYINPYSDKWYFDMVKNLINKLEINLELRWSGIKSKPYT